MSGANGFFLHKLLPNTELELYSILIYAPPGLYNTKRKIFDRRKIDSGARSDLSLASEYILFNVLNKKCGFVCDLR